MAERLEPALERLLREESELLREPSYPPGTVIVRPNRAVPDAVVVSPEPTPDTPVEYGVRLPWGQREILRAAAADQGMTEHELIQSWVAERLSALTDAPAATSTGHVKG